MEFMKEFFEKVDFEKNQQMTKKHEKLPRRQYVKKNSWEKLNEILFIIKNIYEQAHEILVLHIVCLFA